MNDFDYIDIFDDDREQELPAEPSNNFRSRFNDTLADSEDFLSGSRQDRNASERIRINDFKHPRTSSAASRTRQTPRAEKKEEAPSPNPAPAPKKRLGGADEKIVWAGALFVFFGVFVFLIGYWLGKTTMKDVRTTNNEYLSDVQQNLDTSRLNSAFASGGTASRDSATVMGDLPDTTPAPQPQSTTTVTEPVIAPPVAVQATTTTVRHVTATTEPTPQQPRSTTTTVRQTQPSSGTPGNFTIQISAHTAIEKARLVEDKLRSEGYNSYIVESMVNGVQYFRVRVGSFTSKSAAQDALAKLKATAEGRDAYLINLD